MKRIVVLGGGTGGTIAANRLRGLFATDDDGITVVDQHRTCLGAVPEADGGAGVLGR